MSDILRERLKRRSEGVAFKARMGLGGAITLGLGSLLGAGLYVLVGIGVAASGPSLWLAYLICGLLALPSALMYAELSRGIPQSGGGYLYAYQELGGFWGFLVGWLLAMGSVFACALYAIGLASYLVAFFPASWGGGTTVTGVAMGAIVVLSVLGLRGGEGGQKMQGILTWGNVAVLILLLITALFVADSAHLTPHFPKGAVGVGSAISLIYISFFGYQLIANNAEEIREPEKTVPRAMVIALLIALAVYVLVTLASAWAVPADALAASDAPLVLVATQSLGGAGKVIVGVGAVLAAAGALNGTLLGNSRQLFAMGRDRMLPRRFGQVDSKTAVPSMALISAAVFTIGVIAVADLEVVAKAANFALIASMLPLSFALIRVQSRQESGPTPLRRAVPWIAFVANLALLATLDGTTLITGGLLIGAGLGVFIAYSQESAYRGRSGLSVDLAASEALDTSGAGRLLVRGERILVPLANPETHEPLFTIALSLLPALGGEIVALRVVLAREGEDLRVALKRHSEDGKAVAGLDVVEELARQHGATLRPVVRASRELGPGIRHAAKDERCKLVIMGYNAAAGGERSDALIEEVMMGTSHVILFASRTQERPKRVAVSLGSTANLSLMTRIAGALAEQGGGEVFYWSLVLDGHDAEAYVHARSVQAEALKQHSHPVPVQTAIVVAEQPMEALVEMSKGVDVLIVGATSSKFTGSASVGSFSSEVAERAHCSVIIVRVTPTQMMKRLLPSGGGKT